MAAGDAFENEKGSDEGAVLFDGFAGVLGAGGGKAAAGALLASEEPFEDGAEALVCGDEGYHNFFHWFWRGVNPAFWYMLIISFSKSL